LQDLHKKRQAAHTVFEVMNMDSQNQLPELKLPAGTPWSKKKECPPKHTPDPNDPPVPDPTVPNRAHTEMRTAFPPEMPGYRRDKEI
jgi:hypothetical protein